jgi:hypothetical protein
MLGGCYLETSLLAPHSTLHTPHSSLHLLSRVKLVDCHVVTTGLF